MLRHSAAHLMADAILRLLPARRSSRSGPWSRTASTTTSTWPRASITPDDFAAHRGGDGAHRRRGRALPALRGEGPEHDECSRATGRSTAGTTSSRRAHRRASTSAATRSQLLPARRVHRPVPWARTCRARAGSKNVKLTKVAGAYWRADAAREQLVRVYGTAFFEQEGPQGLPPPARGGQKARPPRARRAARPVHLRRGGARASRSTCRRARVLFNPLADYDARALAPARLPGGEGADHPLGGALAHLGPLRRTTSRTCSSRSSSCATRAPRDGARRRRRGPARWR